MEKKSGISKVDKYRIRLRELKDWKPFLRQESGLPGPRGNLELAQAVALEADARQVAELLATPAETAPENSPEVFLVFCGIVALGRQIGGGDTAQVPTLRRYASDDRWRIREAVAMGLQYLGDANIQLLLREARFLSRGNCYERRAAAAALAEPRLLRSVAITTAVLKMLDRITASILGETDRSSESFRALRKGMGYCWSVAVAANPTAGKPLFEKWIKSGDPDVRWILRENLKKNRLLKMDPRWVESCLRRLDHSRVAKLDVARGSPDGQFGIE